jgi:nitrogen fixation/metabolism regulation signal transduction histidine kinase
MQAKPDILALIWGPIKLIIQWASTLKQSFDAIVSTTADIGHLLPEFREVAKLFEHNQQIRDVLVLFLKDMLDFYLITLKFLWLAT